MATPPERDPRAHDPEETPATFEGVGADRVLRPFFEDPILRPVLIGLFGALAVLGAAILVVAFERRSLPAMAALAALLVASLRTVAADLSQRRRLGLTSGSVLTLWTLSVATAVAFGHFGLF